ncbi:MAG: peptidoglycan-binding domain-containing protein [Paracoccaceae bacterium]
MRRLLMTGAALAALSLPAAGADLALLLANQDYATLPDAKDKVLSDDLRGAFEAAGFTVLSEDDADRGEVQARLIRFISEAPESERLVVVLSGYFRHSDRESWLVPVEAKTGDFAEMLERGLPLSAVLTVLAGHPGKALLVLGAVDTEDTEGVEGLVMPGLGALEIPQGVSVLSGTPAEAAKFLSGDFLQPGAALDLAAGQAGLRAAGFLPAGHALIAAAPGVAATSPPPPADPEQAYWDLAEREDTIEGYQLYLERHAKGVHADQARARIAAIKAEPERAAKSAEDALNLSRDQRREIQQNLTVLDFDPRGVDGIFGPGSRAAIARWQAAEGFEANGFVTREQITRLSAQGETRAAQLEAEAAERRAEQERQDRIYWEQTGAAGDEAGLRAYLKKHPDGAFADLAQERLAVFEAERREQAEAADRTAWDNAVKLDTVAGYRDYLAATGAAAFREEAEARIAALETEAAGAATIEQAQAGEDALNLPGVARTLIESRLAQLGLKPGKADGTFDEDTRRAIRRYQHSGNLPVTGYLDQATVAQLLAGSIGLR